MIACPAACQIPFNAGMQMQQVDHFLTRMGMGIKILLKQMRQRFCNWRPWRAFSSEETSKFYESVFCRIHRMHACGEKAYTFLVPPYPMLFSPIYLTHTQPFVAWPSHVMSEVASSDCKEKLLRPAGKVMCVNNDDCPGYAISGGDTSHSGCCGKSEGSSPSCHRPSFRSAILTTCMRTWWQRWIFTLRQTGW